MTDAAGVQKISLLDSLNQNWIKLPLAIMRDVGPAVQTLGGLLKITSRETFVSAAEIARQARLPVPTVRKHLIVLHDHYLIEHLGRCATRSGILRRTATIRIGKVAKEQLEPYGILPWWGSLKGKCKMPWCARAVLSIFMARLCRLKAAVDETTDNQSDEEYAGAIDNIDGDDRFRFSLKWLVEQTGMTPHSVITAKRQLASVGVVRWHGDKPRRGVDTDRHTLAPNWDFRVVETPAKRPGICYVSFEKGLQK